MTHRFLLENLGGNDFTAHHHTAFTGLQDLEQAGIPSRDGPYTLHQVVIRHSVYGDRTEVADAEQVVDAPA